MNRHTQTMVSVIISARNEEKRIGKCLESLALQNYPPESFEIIVINDFSEDNTSQVVRSFSAGFPQLRLIELSDFVRKEDIWSYKKKAIETGISQAKGTLIITTDADCVMPRTWISTIAA
ncbi:MAG TPA: glycosyltransferase, partial [Ginsengibacter sp.]|nr:glycosyltransferase [Ginsengibacter sp.]